MVVVAAATRFAAGILMGTGLAFAIGEGGGSDFAVGLVATAYFLGMMLFAPVWGAVADVTGRRRAVLVTTGLAATLAAAPLAWTPGTWASIGLRGLYAAFAAFSPVMLAIASAGSGTDRGRSIGFFNSARAVGFTGGQLSVGLLLGLLAPAGLSLVVVGLSLVSTLTVAFIPAADGGGDEGGGAASAAAGDGVAARELAGEIRRRLLPAVDERAHLRRRGLRWLYAALALRNAAVLGVIKLMPVYLPRALGLSEFEMGLVLALNPAAQVPFMYLAGRAADRTGRKPLIVAGMAASAAFALVAAGATLPASPTGRFAVAALSSLVVAAGYSAMTVGSLAFIGDIADELRGSASRQTQSDDVADELRGSGADADRESELMGLRSTAKGVGGVVGPATFGAVATVTGYATTFALASALALSATGLVAARLVGREETGRAEGVASAGSD